MSDIADKHLITRAGREAYAARLHLEDARYLEILAFIHEAVKEPRRTENQIIDALELPWEKKPE